MISLEDRLEVFRFFLSEQAYYNRRSHSRKLYGLNVVTRIRTVILFLIEQWHLRKKKPSPEFSMGSPQVVLAYSTANQYKSLVPLADSLNGKILISLSGKVKGVSDETLKWGLRDRFRLSYLSTYLPVLVTILRNSPRHFFRIFHLVILNSGLLEEMVKDLEATPSVRAIIVSNDHTPVNRVAMVAARILGIKSVYLQHASVKDDFPELKFDLSLLEGEDSREKYLAFGKQISGQVKLVGMPKFDGLENHLNNSPTVKAIGLPYGLSSEKEDICRCYRHLLLTFPEVTFTIRKHPSDTLPYVVDPAAYPNLFVSDSTSEDAFDFLQKQDLLVAGNSSIHLEAILLNVASIYFQFTKMEAEHDVYGYVANNLVPEAIDLPELTTMIQQFIQLKKDVRHLAKRYYAPLGTIHDGKVADLIKAELDSFLPAEELYS